MGGINAEILNKLRSCSWRETGLFALNCRRLRWFSFLPLANFKSANAAARCCSGKVSEIPLITNTHVRHHITPTPGARAHVPKTRDKKKKNEKKKICSISTLGASSLFCSKTNMIPRYDIWSSAGFDVIRFEVQTGDTCTAARTLGRSSLASTLWHWHLHLHPQILICDLGSSAHP